MAGGGCASPRSKSSSSQEASTPDAVHLPGIFVDRVALVGRDIEKRIERRTVQAAAAGREG